MSVVMCLIRLQLKSRVASLLTLLLSWLNLVEGTSATPEMFSEELYCKYTRFVLSSFSALQVDLQMLQLIVAVLDAFSVNTRLSVLWISFSPLVVCNGTDIPTSVTEVNPFSKTGTFPLFRYFFIHLTSFSASSGTLKAFKTHKFDDNWLLYGHNIYHESKIMWMWCFENITCNSPQPRNIPINPPIALQRLLKLNALLLVVSRYSSTT